MSTQPRKGRCREFDALNQRFGVIVRGHWNDYGLVRVGHFKTFARAEEYIAAAQGIEGMLFSDDPNSSNLWPPRESRPENQWANERTEERGEICVIVRVPSIAQPR